MQDATPLEELEWDQEEHESLSMLQWNYGSGTFILSSPLVFVVSALCLAGNISAVLFNITCGSKAKDDPDSIGFLLSISNSRLLNG